MESNISVRDHGGLRVAVEGCCHGEFDKIYETMQQLEAQSGKKIDLLICCGDFQAVRNADDLECMACPPKFRHMGTFYKYYSGEKVAPYLTLFIGGNHEAINYMQELYWGGWVAPRIYFLGFAGVVKFGGIRIAGLSGIYKAHHYTMPRTERPPYTDSSMRSAYHVRSVDVNRLLRISKPLDVFLSHDWPSGIAAHGDVNNLLRRKSFLRSEIDDGSLGSPPAAQMLAALRPKYWFSAHLHTKFAALVRHSQGGETRFLSLDKCLPGRQFLQIIDFPEASGPLELAYDEEWLAIVRATSHLSRLHNRPPPPPDPVTDAQLEEAGALMEARNGLVIPENFVATATPHVDGDRRRGRMPRSIPQNPQTAAFLNMLNLSNDAVGWNEAAAVVGFVGRNPEEIDLDDALGAHDDVAKRQQQNLEEIALDDE